MTEDHADYGNQNQLTPSTDPGQAMAAAHQGAAGKDLELTPNQMIAYALQCGVSGDALKALLEARAQLRREQAEEESNKAFTKFQKEAPIIKKTKPVLNKDGKTVRFYFAPMDDVWEQIRPHLARNNFSLSTEGTEIIERPESQHKTWVRVKVYVHHKSGHVRGPGMFEMPIVQSEHMSYQHSVSTAKTIALRNAAQDVLGLVTMDPDTDTEASASNVHNTMHQLARFGVTKEQAYHMAGVNNWGEVSDEALKKWTDALERLREGETAQEVFGGRGAADALDGEQHDPNAPMPKEIFQRLDRAKSHDELEQIQADMDDVLKTEGHKHIGKVKLDQAKRRLGKKSGGQKKSQNQKSRFHG